MRTKSSIIMQLAISNFEVSGTSTEVLNLLNLFSAYSAILKPSYWSLGLHAHFYYPYTSSKIFIRSLRLEGIMARIDI